MSQLFFEKEKDDGNIEYKSQLIDLSEDQIQSRMTQMKYRIEDGNGECIYEIGIFDNGDLKGLNQQDLDFLKSLNNFKLISDNMNYKIIETNIKQIDSKLNKSNEVYFIAEVLIRDNKDSYDYIDIKIAVAGNVDAAKSTTIGVLTSG